MAHIQHDVGIARQIGRYSDAIETAAGSRWLHTAGTPGLAPDGRLSEDFTEQARQAWENVVAALAKADMGLDDIVKVTTSLTRAEDMQAYVEVRSSFMGERRPAYMLAVVNQLIRPEMRVEVEVIAAKKPGDATI